MIYLIISFLNILGYIYLIPDTDDEHQLLPIVSQEENVPSVITSLYIIFLLIKYCWNIQSEHYTISLLCCEIDLHLSLLGS